MWWPTLYIRIFVERERNQATISHALKITDTTRVLCTQQTPGQHIWRHIFDSNGNYACRCSGGRTTIVAACIMNVVIYRAQRWSNGQRGCRNGENFSDGSPSAMLRRITDAPGDPWPPSSVYSVKHFLVTGSNSSCGLVRPIRATGMRPCVYRDIFRGKTEQRKTFFPQDPTSFGSQTHTRIHARAQWFSLIFDARNCRWLNH